MRFAKTFLHTVDTSSGEGNQIYHNTFFLHNVVTWPGNIFVMLFYILFFLCFGLFACLKGISPLKFGKGLKPLNVTLFHIMLGLCMSCGCYIVSYLLNHLSPGPFSS